jgi:NADPH oxidase
VGVDPGFCAYARDNNTYNDVCNGLDFTPAGPTSWMFLLCGLLIYGLERILRIVRSFYSVVIIKVIKHPSNTIEIQMRRKGFHAEAGQYVFLNCPRVAFFEWHPFTLTSAPEEDYFSVHIRVLGDWTKEIAEKLGAETNEFQQSWELPNMYVDGPFGTASEDVFEHSVALLVGAGIGVTPFASVLKSVYYRLSENSSGLPLKKLYFVWICPETHAFEWFANLLHELEQQLHERGIDDFLTSWIYLTRGWKDNQAFYIMLNEGRVTNEDASDDMVDAITGLRAETIFGRPEWEKVFERVATTHPNTDVGVFFCGPSVLSHNLHNRCNDFTKRGGSTGARFYYNKENF